MATTAETIGIAAFGVLTLSGLMLIAGLLFRAEQRQKAEAVVWTDSVEIENSCYANRSDITCTFTNKLATPVLTCVQGTLTPKESKGVTLKSLTLCSGRLAPLETKAVTAPWVGGFADDLCYRENQFGKQLDWSKCDFNTGPVNLRASMPAGNESPVRALGSL